MKRAAWLMNKLVFVQDAGEQGQILVTDCDERDNISDGNTKYIVYGRWKMHLRVICNVDDPDTVPALFVRKDKQRATSDSGTGKKSVSFTAGNHEPVAKAGSSK